MVGFWLKSKIFPDIKAELLYLEVKIGIKPDMLPTDGKSGSMWNLCQLISEYNMEIW